MQKYNGKHNINYSSKNSVIMNIFVYLEMSQFVVEMTEECETLFRVFIQIEIILVENYGNLE